MIALLIVHPRKKNFYGQTIRFGDGEQAPFRGRQLMEKSRHRGSPNWRVPRRQKHFSEALDRLEHTAVSFKMKMNWMKIGKMSTSDRE
jgi:hypothetical protein